MSFGRVCIAVLIATLLTACIPPKDRRPGFRLPGEVMPFPSDWSFAQEHPLIAIEVRTPYWLPHSVTVARGAFERALIVGARDPETKWWPGWVDDDPEVRLGIGAYVYEAKLVPITEPTIIARIRARAAENSGSPTPPPELETRVRGQAACGTYKSLPGHKFRFPSSVFGGQRLQWCSMVASLACFLWRRGHRRAT